jgi:hypothetical protein
VAISTYSELLVAVSNWLARSDLDTRTPEFIALAEAKFNRDLNCSQQETRAYSTCDISTDEPEFISLPPGFLSMRRIRLSGVTGKPRLQFLSQQQIDDYRGDTTGQPIYFSISGDEIELAPTPDQNYEIEMVYRAAITPLTALSPTNWLLTFAPDAYLYGTLMEACPYLKDEQERIPIWSAGLRHAIDGLNRLTLHHNYGAGPAQVTVPGYNP